MKAESLQARDLDFDSFLASNFDDFQSFTWGPSASYPVARGPSGNLDGLPLPNSINEVFVMLSSEKWEVTLMEVYLHAYAVLFAQTTTFPSHNT